MSKPKILLEEILRYDPETGKLFWKERPLGSFKKESRGKVWNKRWAGKEALCCVHKHGYLYGNLFGKKQLAHRVIWALHYDEWPEGVDHEDNNPQNNLLLNLRACNQQKNMCNRGKTKANTSGYKGVVWQEDRKKWVARIRFKGEAYYLGGYEDPVEAARAYDLKSLELHKEFGQRNYSNAQT